MDDELRARLDGFPRIALRDKGRRRAAVALTLSGEVPSLWLTRRASKMRAHPGQFALPGGRVDEGEDAVAGALRELREELGVTADRSRCLGMLDDYATRSGYVITPIVVRVDDPSGLAPNPAEVAEVFTIPLPDLGVEPRLLDIPESDRPVIQLPLVGSLIHAPTAAILYQFAELALHGRITRVGHFEQPVFAWR